MSDIKALYTTRKRNKTHFMIIAVLVLVISAFVALCISTKFNSPLVVLQNYGHAFFPSLIDATSAVDFVILTRIISPRVLVAVITGFSLGLAGTVMQGLLRNPLVSPFTLGLSSAAGFGAALIMVVGPVIASGLYYSSFSIIGEHITGANVMVLISAFAFGLLSMGAVLLMCRSKNASQSVIILAGVIIGYLFQAGITALKYISNDNALREITIWLMGGMWGVNWSSCLIILPICLICSIVITRQAKFFNVMSGGDDVARSLGVDVHKFRSRSLIIVTLMASACIGFTGIIGFVGLMAPHICRMLIGNDHRYLLLASGLMGAIILLISDTVARVILLPQELPVGVIMYVLGGIFFIYLITKKRGSNLE